MRLLNSEWITKESLKSVSLNLFSGPLHTFWSYGFKGCQDTSLFQTYKAANFWLHVKPWNDPILTLGKKSLTCCICCWSLFLCAGSRIRVWGTFSLWGFTLSTSCCCLAEDFFNFSCSSSSFIVRCCSFSRLASGSSNLSPTGRWLNLTISLGPQHIQFLLMEA